MEVKGVSGVRYAVPTAPIGQKKPTADAQQKKSGAPQAVDRVELSKAAPKDSVTEAVERLEQARQERELALQEQEQRVQQREMMLEQAENARAQGDEITKAMKARLKCMQILSRIMAGDNVPLEDSQYLMENDIEGYQLAMAMRRVKEDPKDWDRLTEDEEQAAGESAPTPELGGATSGEAAPPEVPDSPPVE